ncbi:hypothetical protein CFI11_12155 [Thalassococcus sp. S3]|nr:hypothetical protein CFI11_12155 [Thalassococcus sp. S3]
MVYSASLKHRSALLAAFTCIALLWSAAAQAADRGRLEAFLEVTGFDVALESIKLSASSAPQMIGMDPNAFGADWTRVTQDVFDVEVMHDLALDILEKTLSDPLLNHAAAFYASDLGQRLVVAENASHLKEDDEDKQEEGAQIVADLVQTGAARLQILQRMNRAVDVAGASVRALQEIQMRFLLAASAAGVIDLRMDAEDLRAVLSEREGALRRAIQQSSLAGAAYTYEPFSDADLEAYAEALEHPDMQEVYVLMNAVQYEIMANRFEVLARRMADLHPGQDI